MSTGILRKARNALLGGNGSASYYKDAHNTIFFYMELVCLLWIITLWVKNTLGADFEFEQFITLSSVLAGSGTLSSLRKRVDTNGNSGVKHENKPQN